MIELNKYYQDRGMQKYAGFHISEHRGKIEATRAARSFKNAKKPRLSQLEIETILAEAQLKSLEVGIQLEAVDIEGNYFDDVLGSVDGFDELGIYVGGVKVHYDEIRHIQLVLPKKWFLK